MRQMLVALNAAQIEFSERRRVTSFSPPQSPIDSVEQLRAVVASTNMRSVVSPIAEIMREIQTLWARTEVLRDQTRQDRLTGLDRNIDDWIIQAAQIHALIESLYAYARGQEDEGPTEVQWERAQHIIFHLQIESEKLTERIRTNLENSPNFWTLE